MTYRCNFFFPRIDRTKWTPVNVWVLTGVISYTSHLHATTSWGGWYSRAGTVLTWRPLWRCLRRISPMCEKSQKRTRCFCLFHVHLHLRSCEAAWPCFSTLSLTYLIASMSLWSFLVFWFISITHSLTFCFSGGGCRRRDISTFSPCTWYVFRVLLIGAAAVSLSPLSSWTCLCEHYERPSDFALWGSIRRATLSRYSCQFRRVLQHSLLLCSYLADHGLGHGRCLKSLLIFWSSHIVAEKEEVGYATHCFSLTCFFGERRMS